MTVVMMARLMTIRNNKEINNGEKQEKGTPTVLKEAEFSWTE